MSSCFFTMPVVARARTARQARARRRAHGAVRILILNERDPRHPKTGGAETHVHEIFRRIAARGHAVTEIVSSFAGGAGHDEIDAIGFERIAALPIYYPAAAARCAR